MNIKDKLLKIIKNKFFIIVCIIVILVTSYIIIEEMMVDNNNEIEIIEEADDIFKKDEEENFEEKNILKEINNMATEEYSKEKIEELSKELEWKYKYKDSTVLPTKTYCSKFIVSPYSSKSRFKSSSKHIGVFKIDCISFDISNTF